MFGHKFASKYLQENAWILFAVSGPVLAAAIVVFVIIFFPAHPGLHAIGLAGETVYVSIADTEVLREQGLGGRENIAPDEGMLFVYQQDGTYAYWMKDMLFAIDMLWIANDGTIIYIQGDVVPATYPQSFQPTSGLARYVLELPAGYAIQHNIKAGDKVSI